MSPKSRAGAAILVVAALAASYLLGWRAATSNQSPVEQATDSILSRSAKTIDRAALQRAAIEGMLRASGDRWSSFYNAKQFAFYNEALLEYGAGFDGDRKIFVRHELVD